MSNGQCSPFSGECEGQCFYLTVDEEEGEAEGERERERERREEILEYDRVSRFMQR